MILGSMIEAELMETVLRRMVLLEMHKVKFAFSRQITQVLGWPVQYLHSSSYDLQLMARPRAHYCEIPSVNMASLGGIGYWIFGQPKTVLLLQKQAFSS